MTCLGRWFGRNWAYSDEARMWALSQKMAQKPPHGYHQITSTQGLSTINITKQSQSQAGSMARAPNLYSPLQNCKFGWIHGIGHGFFAF